MKTSTNVSMAKAGKKNHVRVDGSNWLLIAGGLLLSTFSIRIGCKIKQIVDSRQQNDAIKAKRRVGSCQLHAELYRLTAQHNGCCYCISGVLNGPVDIKQEAASPVCSDTQMSLPLANASSKPNKEKDGVIWTASPDRLEPPRKPLRYSNSSDSPCASESGSDIYTKREVIQKLRQQLKRRDEMIMDMQIQITDLKSTLNIQASQSASLQSQLDAVNRDLFESEREVQHLRKIVADHCVAEALNSDKQLIRSWHAEFANGYVNGYADSSIIDHERKAEEDRLGMLKIEVEELKEVIGGKDFLLHSYKEQKVELCSKIKELQAKLEPHVPNIL